MGMFDLFLKKAPVRSPSEAPASPVKRWSERRPTIQYSDSVDAERALSHPIIYRCLDKLASSVASVRWYCEVDPNVIASERAQATVVKKINDLLQSPNDLHAQDQLRYWMTMTYAVYGRVPFKVGIGVESNPNGIYPLDPRYVKIKDSSRGSVTSYTYGANDSSETLPSRRAAKAGQAYLYEIFTPNLEAALDAGRNVNAMRAIGLPSEVSKLLLQRAVDTASGHPNSKYIVTAEKTLSKKQKEAILEHVENSEPTAEESGRVLFLFNTDVKVHKLDNDLSDIHSKMPLDDMTRLIAGAFGIPISLLGLGAADGAKFAGNYSESRRSFWEDTITPSYLVPIATGLTAALCPPGCRVMFDLDSIPALQDSRVARALQLADVPFLTSTEKRELCGYAKDETIPELLPTLTPQKEPKPADGNTP